MAPLDRRYFTKPLAALAILLLGVIPSLLVATVYTYHPTADLDDGPRLLFGKSGTTVVSSSSGNGGSSSGNSGSVSTGGGRQRVARQSCLVVSKEDSQRIVPRGVLGYNSPVDTDNAIVAYSPRELFAAALSPHQMMWFGVVCPLTSAEADAYEAEARQKAARSGVPVDRWVSSRPLYSFDCTRSYPYGFDFTVVAKLPMYHMQQFRLEMWSGRETPMRGIRSLANLSIADYRVAPQPRYSVAGEGFVGEADHIASFGAPPPALFAPQQADVRRVAETPVEASLVLSTDGGYPSSVGNSNSNKNYNNNNFASPAQQQSSSSSSSSSDASGRAPNTSPSGAPIVGNYVANAASKAHTEVIKTCDKITDECVQASMFTYTRSYKLMHPQSSGVGYNGRLAAQLPATDGLWQLSLSADLGTKTVAEVDIAVVAAPATYWRSTHFRALAGLIFLSLFLSLFIAVKLVGLFARDRDTTRIFAVIDPSHDEIVLEGWEDLRRLAQSWAFAATEARGRWAARRRRYRRAAASEAELSASASASREGGVDGAAAPAREIIVAGTVVSLVDDNGAPLSPTSLLAAKAKASALGAKKGANGGAAAPAYPSSSSEEEGDVCRICRVGASEGELVAPCACAGTSRFVHRACLEQWRAMTSNPEHRRVCAECKTEYNVAQQVPQRSVGERFIAVMAPFIKLGSILVGFILLAYGVKVVGFLSSGLDPHMDWSVNFYHIFIGSLALCSVMIVFSNGLWYVIDFPKTLLHRAPALILLGVGGPILLGYAAQLWCAVLFETVVTPEISFGTGVFTFVAFVNNALVKLADVLTPASEPLRRRHADAVAEVAAAVAANEAIAAAGAGNDAEMEGGAADGGAGAEEEGDVAITVASLAAHNNRNAASASTAAARGAAPPAAAAAAADAANGVVVVADPSEEGGDVTSGAASSSNAPRHAVVNVVLRRELGAGAASTSAVATGRAPTFFTPQSPTIAAGIDVHPALASISSVTSATASASAAAGGARGDASADAVEMVESPAAPSPQPMA